MTEIHTNRLVLRELVTSDDEFVCALMNDAAWLANIGDRGIRTRSDACRYLLEGPWARYRELGFGFYAVERLGVPEPIGVCGLAKRDFLDAPDIGFAFLPAHRGLGYAMEAADAVLRFAARIGLSRVVATTRPENLASRRILEKLNMVQESSFVSPSSGHPVLLYAMRLPPAGQDAHGS